MAKLLLKKDGVVIESLYLKPGPNRCGRKPENDIVINDSSVSGCHCELETSDGLLLVRDLGSTNGTFISGEQTREGLVEPGRSFRLGDVEVVYEENVPVSSGWRAGALRPEGLPPGMRPLAEPAQFENTGSLRIAKSESPALPVPPPMREDFRRVAAPPPPLPRWNKSFFQSLPDAFVYPLKRDGLILLVCGGGVFAILDAISSVYGSIVLATFSYGYLAAFMQKIVSYSAQGQDDMPDWPEFTNYWDDILHPAFLLSGCFLVSLGPALGFWVFAEMEPSTKLMIGMALVAFGCFYLPMALMAVSMYNSIFALNPLLIVPSILRIPKEYLVACLVLGVVAAMRLFGAFVLNLIPIPVVPTLIMAFLSLYFVTMEMRILGILYFAKRRELNWSF